MHEQVKDQFNSPNGHIAWDLLDLEGNILEHGERGNLAVDAAKIGFAQILNDESGFTGIINYGAIGSGANTPNVADTDLQTETARSVIETQSRAGKIVTITFYFDPTQGTGDVKEFGAFIDGTASANSGTLFDRVNLNITKTALNSLRITLTITVA